MSRPSLVLARLTALGVLLAAPTLPLHAQDSYPDAAEVLTQQRATLGSEEALAAVEFLIVEGDVRIDELDEPGVFTELFARDGRAFLSTQLPGMAAHDQGTIGGVFWEEDLRIGARTRDEIRSDVARRKYGLLRHQPWTELYLRAEVVGIETIEGRDCWKIKMIPNLGRADRWFVDIETHRLTRTTTRLSATPEQVIEFSTTYRDWREVDGVSYAFERVVSAGTSTLVRRVTSLVHTDECSPARFSPPISLSGQKEPPGTLPRLRRIPPRRVLSVRSRCKPEEVGLRMSEGVRAVAEHLAKLETQPVGPPFTRYHRLGEQEVELEAGMPVEATVEAAEGLTVGTLPGGQALDVWHYGPLETINASYAKLSAALTEFGLEQDGGQWEVYWTPPGRPEQGLSRTQLVIPVRPAKKAEAQQGAQPAESDEDR